MAAETWRRLYPFESHWRPLPGGRCHYLDEGARNGNGQQVSSTLLLVHGNPTWSFYWRRLVQAFSDQHRVVVPDHLGCGLSDKPRDLTCRLEDHIKNLVRLIDDLDLQHVTLVGHDWGGAIGLGAALERVARIERLVLINTGAFPPPYIPWRIRICRTPVLGRCAVQGLYLFSRAALRMAVNDRRSLPQEVRAGMLAPYDSWSNRRAVYRFVEDIPASPRHPTWQTLERIEAALHCLADRPVQLIWGMRDWCFRPSCLARFEQHFPAARVLRLPTAGHWVVEEAPAEVESCVREFLAQTAPVGR